MINFEYTRVTTVKAAIDTLAKNPDGGFIAGGTNLVDLMKKGVTAPARLIDINNIEPLKTIKEDGKGIHIGALALNSEVAIHPTILNRYPLLAQALKAGASAQLRNMATVGGNMMQRTRCSYFYDISMPCNKRNPNSGCGAIGGYNRMHAIFGASDKCIAVHPSDMCVALAALDATVELSGPKGNRSLPFTDFHRLPGDTPEKDNNLAKGELITGVMIPPQSFNKNYYLKIRDRASYAFALVSVAVALDVKNNTIEKARIAMGGVAHKPWRLTETESFLTGKTISEGLFAEAADISLRNAKTFQHNAFKIKLGKAAVIEALNKAG